MSFLLRRNRPKAWADWHDLDSATARANETPIRQPWGQWGNPNQTANLVSNEMVLVDASGQAFNFGGWSFEHSVFTPYWGVDFDVSVTESSSAAFFGAYVDAPWSKVGSDFNDVLRLDFRREAPIGGGAGSVRLTTFTNVNDAGTVRAQNTTPGSGGFFNGAWHSVSMLVDNDADFRVFIDGGLYLYASIPATYRPADGRRAVNFVNRTTNDAKVRTFRLYDRAFDLAWSSVFFDDFNRANGAVGNGWTQQGTDAGIVSNSWSTTGTTDGGRAIIRDTGITDGRCRVEGVIGGNIGIGSTQHSDLILCSNSAGTQCLAARVNNSTISLGRYSTALTNASPTFTQFASFSVSCANGDTVAAGVRDSYLYVDRNAERIGFAGSVHDVVPASNSWYGLRVKREAFGNSFSWNDCRILDAA